MNNIQWMVWICLLLWRQSKQQLGSQSHPCISFPLATWNQRWPWALWSQWNWIIICSITLGTFSTAPCQSKRHSGWSSLFSSFTMFMFGVAIPKVSMELRTAQEFPIFTQSPWVKTLCHPCLLQCARWLPVVQSGKLQPGYALCVSLFSISPGVYCVIHLQYWAGFIRVLWADWWPFKSFKMF